MSYFAPYVDESGLHYPTYDDVLEDLIDAMQAIYGAGVYLGSDSKDYQLLSKFAEKIYDTYQALEIAYNAHSPVTAIGTGLDYIVALNGISRKPATCSTVRLTLTGAAGTVIRNGRALDGNGNRWELPEQVTLDAEGTATVNAICEVTGAVQATAGTITGIATPTRGWESVTNPEDAVAGAAVERDSELRARQAQSVAQPAQSVLEALKGALRSLDGVQRVECYENYTGETDGNGLPPHSVCCVVEGGDDDEIAQTIRLSKGMGCATHGDESITVQDASGQSSTIRFSHVTYVDVDITVNIKRKNGYAASTASEIAAAIADYLSDFSIGTDLTTSVIWMVAQQVNTDYRTPTFSISSVLAARHGETQQQSDVSIGFDEVASGSVSNITVNVS